jgi:hypothetical protein
MKCKHHFLYDPWFFSYTDGKTIIFIDYICIYIHIYSHKKYICIYVFICINMNDFYKHTSKHIYMHIYIIYIYICIYNMHSLKSEAFFKSSICSQDIFWFLYNCLIGQSEDVLPLISEVKLIIFSNVCKFGFTQAYVFSERSYLLFSIVCVEILFIEAKCT